LPNILKTPVPHPSDLRRRAEKLLKSRPPEIDQPQTESDAKRLLHELQVHHLELEMQNAELREARDAVETQLGRYTDLYDFAPVGYYSIDESGVILEVNLTGAALLGVERSRLLKKRLLAFVSPKSLTTFHAFLRKIFTCPQKQVCVVSLLTERGAPFWADLQATPASSVEGTKKWSRLVVSDLTTLKQAEEVLQRMEGLTTANRELKLEIVRKEMAEAALKKAEAQARDMQEQLRHLSHQLLLTQEEERKRISRELHDEIVQTLVGINVHLASLTLKKKVNLNELRRKISRTQRLVEKSVEIVHRFARELRPTVLDDLGLIPALQSFIREFAKRTKLRVEFTASDEIEQLDNTQRTVIYRVTLSALANVDQHAHASKVSVSLQRNNDAICLEIHDDGRSFEVAHVMSAKRYKRLGLLGSRERIEMVGGKFSVESTPRKGTTIRAEIPMNGVPGKRVRRRSTSPRVKLMSKP